MTEPIRVLQVVGKMNYGGMETLIMNIYRNIDREKIQFDILVHYDEPGKYDEEILSLGGHIYHMPKTSIRNYFKYKKALNSFFSSHKEYKIVHGHLQSTAFLYHSIGKKHGVKCCITHAHTNGAERSMKGWIVLFTSRLAEKYTDVFFACSKNAARFSFPKVSKKDGNVIIVRNAIDVSKFKFNEETREKKRNELGVANNFVVGHVGRFSFQKNHEFLIDVFKEIYGKNSSAVLLLVGDGVDKDKIMAKVRHMGLEDAVMFLGLHCDVSEILQAIDVFILPSKIEGLGIALIEAQAAGLKCFASANIVPEEAKVTNLLDFISLNSSPSFWADEVLKYKNGYKRLDMTKQIKKAGYNIHDVAKWIEGFYLNKNN